MLAILPILVALSTAPLLAAVVLVIRLRDALRRNGRRALTAALRQGLRRPVWPALIALALAAAGLAAGLGQLYLAVVANASRWEFDVVLLALTLVPLGALGCGALCGITAAAVARVRGFGAGAIAGLLGVVAIAAGWAAAHLPLRAAYLADPQSFPIVPNLGEGDLLLPFDSFPGMLILALPWPLLAAALAATQPAGHKVRDVWQLLLELATADLPDGRAAWSCALRAELAAIDVPAERRRFALGGMWTAIRSGAARGTWLQATGVALAVAAGSFAASRWSLAHSRGGILDFWVAFPTFLLLVLAFVAAWRTASFSAAMRAAAVAGLAAMVAVLAVGIPEAMVWAGERAGYLSTGDAVPPNWQAAVRDVLRPEFLAGMAVFWVIGAASGAALGKALAPRRERMPDEAPADPVSS